MRPVALSILTLAMLTSVSCYAQDLTVTSFQAASVATPQTTTVTKLLDADGQLISSVSSKPVDGVSTDGFTPIVRVETLASKVTVSASDATRSPVAVTKVDGKALYSIESGRGQVWVRVMAVDFKQDIFAEDTVVVLSGDPIEPDDPSDNDTDVGGTLADKIYRLTQPFAGDSVSASTIAKTYRSVAGRAAGLSAMNHAAMLTEVRNQLNAKLGDGQRNTWAKWATSAAQTIADEKLGDSKPKHIKAFLQVAKGVERAIRSPSKHPVPVGIPQPTPAGSPFH